jgi:hypothetical protein
MGPSRTAVRSDLLAAAPAAKVLKVSVEADVFERSPTLHHPIIFGNVRADLCGICASGA